MGLFGPGLAIPGRVRPLMMPAYDGSGSRSSAPCAVRHGRGNPDALMVVIEHLGDALMKCRHPP